MEHQHRAATDSTTGTVSAAGTSQALGRQGLENPGQLGSHCVTSWHTPALRSWPWQLTLLLAVFVCQAPPFSPLLFIYLFYCVSSLIHFYFFFVFVFVFLPEVIF